MNCYFYRTAWARTLMTEIPTQHKSRKLSICLVHGKFHFHGAAAQKSAPGEITVDDAAAF
jgi:hypothetical protein